MEIKLKMLLHNLKKLICVTLEIIVTPSLVKCTYFSAFSGAKGENQVK